MKTLTLYRIAIIGLLVVNISNSLVVAKYRNMALTLQNNLVTANKQTERAINLNEAQLKLSKNALATGVGIGILCTMEGLHDTMTETEKDTNAIFFLDQNSIKHWSELTMMRYNHEYATYGELDWKFVRNALGDPGLSIRSK